MSQALSNLSLFLPLSSGKSSNGANKPICSRYPSNTFKAAVYGEGIYRKNRVMAMAGENRDNLDHLRRVSSQQPNHQPQPKKRVAPTAPVGLWDRFPTARTVQQMMETMERMIEDPFAYSGEWSSPLMSETGGYSRGRTPWEIKEGEAEFKLRFDMPGMTKEDVKVWVEEKMLVVKAEKVPKKKSQNGNGPDGEEEEWSAKSYGRYSSRIALPENVQFEKIKAEVKDGVLYITIPKAASTSKILDINVQ